jgi:ABC-type uncharacterized transport system ATPase subunit
MEQSKPFGIYLFSKERQGQHVLKDLLQFLKSLAPGKPASFAYVEAQTSLIPDLSLWENLHLEAGGGSWLETAEGAAPEVQQLMRLVLNPEKVAQEAESWERFSVSLMKAVLMPAPNVIIDMNEELLSPLLIQNLKQTLLKISANKRIFFASARPALWLDCSHSMVVRKDYQFEIQPLDQESIKRHWAA